MIRKIEQKDIPVCLEWYNRYIENSTATFETEQLSLPQFEERVRTVTRKYPWLILEEEGQPAGYVYLSPFMSRAAYDWTADVSVYVDPEKRGRGYGRVLLEEIIRIAKEAGFRNLISIITSENHASLHLHRKLGFQFSGELKSFGYKFGTWLSVCNYTLEVNPDADVNRRPFSDQWGSEL
ncbi:MAG: N-acetyltransferase [Erysipelotrichaceae bacterium]|nr:N-acetyltransferase [Erysipelotrichaceae bacterium]